jgi:hypothetical protein
MSADHVPAPAPLAAEEACTDDGDVLLSRFEIAARFSIFSIRSSSGTNAWGLPRADQNKSTNSHHEHSFRSNFF